MKRQPYYDIKVRGVIARSGARLYEIQEGRNIGYVDAEHFARNPSDALAGLVSCGLTFLGGKRTKLNEALAEVDDFDEAHLFDRIGHNGEHFVYPTGEVFSPPDTIPGRIIFTPPSGKCHRAGSLGGWLSGVALPLAGHSICEFFMMLPFVGPLRAYTRRAMNFGWEIVGDGATGKSVLLLLMGSTCGGALGGDAGNFGLSFSATGPGIEWEFQNYSDLIMLIDEGNLYEMNQAKGARGRAFSELLMALGMGQEKHRYRTTARTFKFVFATTANETLLDIIGGTSAKAVTDAVADRLMTIPLRDREFGIFDRLPENYEDTGDFFADLVNAAEQHHGLAMPNYLQQVVNFAAADREAFVERIEFYVSEFRRHACVEANAGSARRVAEAFGLVYAAGQLAIHTGSLPDEFDPLASTLACYRLHRAAFMPEPSAAQILVALLDDSEVIDLDQHPLPHLTKHEFEKCKAFRKTNKHGELEILVPPRSIRRLIPDWNSVRRDDFEVARMIIREEDAHTVKRKVRENSTSDDRVICIVPDQTSPPAPAPAPRPTLGKGFKKRRKLRRSRRSRE